MFGVMSRSGNVRGFELGGRPRCGPRKSAPLSWPERIGVKDARVRARKKEEATVIPYAPLAA